MLPSIKMIPNAAMALINCFLALSIFFMGMLISTDFLILKPFYLPNLKLTELKANPDLAKRGAKGIDSSLEYCRCRGSSFYFVLAFNAGILKAEDKMTLKNVLALLWVDIIFGERSFWCISWLVSVACKTGMASPRVTKTCLFGLANFLVFCLLSCLEAATVRFQNVFWLLILSTINHN